MKMSFLNPFLDRIKSINFRDGNVVMLIAWIGSSILAVTIPVSNWNSNKSDYYSSYGKYIEYENEQREYEEQQNNDGNNDDDGNYYYKECSWSNWRCRKQQYNYAMMDDNGSNDNDNDNGVTIPDWYIFLGGKTEEMQRWTEENTGRRGAEAESTGAEKFVYAWTLVMFFSLVAYGTYALHKRHPATAIVVFLLIFAQFCLLQLILLAQGVISADDRDLEDSVYGWYGQAGVLLAYTNFWIVLFCAIFSVVFIVKGFLERRGNGGTSQTEAVSKDGAADGDAYHSADGDYDSPQIQMTSA
mmetsp:Transcript_51041/g.153430  ORF Transcript_51041/g.153430 Transcript_51041/m.153430 type:complete len:300 (-) Transcript_51041:525-1424(-)